METLTLSPLQTAPLLLRTHGIAALSLTPLGSELASTFRVDTNEGPIALKVQASGPATRPEQAWRTEVTDRLAQLGHPVPRQVLALDGGLGAFVSHDEDEGSGDMFVSATEWVAALPYSQVGLGTGARFGAHLGEVAARMQLSLASLPHPPRAAPHTWAAHTMSEVIIFQLRELAAQPGSAASERAVTLGRDALAMYQRWVAPVEADLPTALVHQDLHDDNVLATAAGEIAAIIDFDDMLVSWRVAEPAVAAAYLARHTGDPVAALNAIAAGWETMIPFTEAERRVYAPVAAMRLALNAIVWQVRSEGDRAAYAASRSGGSADAFYAIAETLG